MEKGERIGRTIENDSGVAIKGEHRMAQTVKKPGKTRISEDDWNRYVDAVRQASRTEPATKNT